MAEISDWEGSSSAEEDGEQLLGRCLCHKEGEQLCQDRCFEFLVCKVKDDHFDFRLADLGVFGSQEPANAVETEKALVKYLIGDIDDQKMNEILGSKIISSNAPWLLSHLACRVADLYDEEKISNHLRQELEAIISREKLAHKLHQQLEYVIFEHVPFDIKELCLQAEICDTEGQKNDEAFPIQTADAIDIAFERFLMERLVFEDTKAISEELRRYHPPNTVANPSIAIQNYLSACRQMPSSKPIKKWIQARLRNWIPELEQPTKELPWVLNAVDVAWSLHRATINSRWSYGDFMRHNSQLDECIHGKDLHDSGTSREPTG